MICESERAVAVVALAGIMTFVENEPTPCKLRPLGYR